MFKFLFSLPKRILASNQDGPPDLDELFKDLRNKLGGILGQKKLVIMAVVVISHREMLP